MLHGRSSGISDGKGEKNSNKTCGANKSNMLPQICTGSIAGGAHIYLGLKKFYTGLHKTIPNSKIFAIIFIV